MSTESNSANPAGADGGQEGSNQNGEVKNTALGAKPGEGVVDPAKAGGEAKPGDEGKAKDGKEGEAKDGKKADEVKAGAPDKYEDFKLPDGIAVDEAAMTEAQGLFKELNLDQAGAQKLVDLQGKLMTQVAQAQQKSWDDLTEGWVKSAKEDPEYGGANYDANLGLANKVIAKFGSPKLVEALTSTRTGDHPELIRIFVKIGKAIGEDNLAGEGDKGGPSAGQRKSTGDVFYDNPKSK